MNKNELYLKLLILINSRKYYQNKIKKHKLHQYHQYVIIINVVFPWIQKKLELEEFLLYCCFWNLQIDLLDTGYRRIIIGLLT